MTRIVAGVFDDEQQATAAAHELHGAGFDAGELDQFVLGPPGRHDALPTGGDEPADPKAKGGDAGAVKGAAVGTAIGAVVGLAGAANTMGDDRPAPQPRPAGVMVAVSTDTGEDEELAIDLLRDHRARMIERAEGTWRNGKWADFDPVAPPDVIESHVAGSAPQHAIPPDVRR